MLSELPMFLAYWGVGLFIILLPSCIVKLFGKEIEK
jgi:hypothetical protein